jgi:hypothetical protein
MANQSSLEKTIFPDGRAPREKRLVVDMDNAPVHNCGMTTSFLADHNMVRLQYRHTRRIPPRVTFTYFRQ